MNGLRRTLLGVVALGWSTLAIADSSPYLAVAEAWVQARLDASRLGVVCDGGLRATEASSSVVEDVRETNYDPDTLCRTIEAAAGRVSGRQQPSRPSRGGVWRQNAFEVDDLDHLSTLWRTMAADMDQEARLDGMRGAGARTQVHNVAADVFEPRTPLRLRIQRPQIAPAAVDVRFDDGASLATRSRAATLAEAILSGRFRRLHAPAESTPSAPVVFRLRYAEPPTDLPQGARVVRATNTPALGSQNDVVQGFLVGAPTEGAVWVELPPTGLEPGSCLHLPANGLLEVL